MPWLWLFTAVVVLTLGAVRGPAGPRGGVRRVGTRRSFSRRRCPSGCRRVWPPGPTSRRRTRRGGTPLHSAAESTSTPAVLTALLAAGADPTARAKYGETPLHWAVAFNKTPAVITTLVTAGADPTAQSKAGETPLHWAVAFNKTPAVLTALLAAGGRPHGAEQGR